MTSQYAAVRAFFVRVAGYAGVVHGVGDVGQSAVIARITLGLTACTSVDVVGNIGETLETLSVVVYPCCSGVLVIRIGLASKG